MGGLHETPSRDLEATRVCGPDVAFSLIGHSGLSQALLILAVSHCLLEGEF
jgi:hypothetical protein